MPLIRKKWNTIEILDTKLGGIQHIALMSIIDFFCEICRLDTQTLAPTIPGFQGIKCCVKYIGSLPHKPIFYPYNYYDG